jgi:alkylhydroperoxidase family enzyme
MRLPYVLDPIPAASAADAAIVERLRLRRAPGKLLKLDRALLHAPAVADGWNSFFGCIRERSTLTDDIRELAICRVAVLTNAHFEWLQHAPLAEQAGLDIAALKLDGEGLTAKQTAVLRYTDEMTKGIEVSDDIWLEIRNFFSDREVVELTATIAAYNCCSRFLVALDIGGENGKSEDDVYLQKDDDKKPY